MTAPLPAGFTVRLDPGTRQLSDGSLFGGSPARVVRLTSAGRAALAEVADGPARSPAARLLARRLTDAGLAHPVPAAAPLPGRLTVTVIIPVRDRTLLLDRCLRAVTGQYPVLVVDDGSADQDAVRVTASRYGADLHRCTVAGGPAAARNAGLAATQAPIVAFLDSDCEPPSGWIAALAAHFADPLVAAVAPRIVPAAVAASSAASRYSAACSSLDLGARAARVQPGSRVSYVPTAALLVRREALRQLAGPAFDERLRYGEDVDLVWRLNEAGWRIRYEPVVEVAHAEPDDWPALLGRRFRYGTSAAPLARRHPASLAPLVLQPWPALTVAALLGRRPLAAAAGLTACWLDLSSAVRRAGVPADGAPAAAATAVRQTWLGLGRYATQFAAPVIAAMLATPGGASARRRWGRRAAAASLLLGPALTGYRQRRPALDPVRFTLAAIADDICYGAGVWAGCVRERTFRPVLPVVSRRPVRFGSASETSRASETSQDIERG